MNLRKLEMYPSMTRKGDLYVCRESTAICNRREIGLVVDIYDDGSAMILFASGNYDGFNISEIKRYLIFITNIPLDYTFTNVIKLQDAFLAKKFMEHFDFAHAKFSNDSSLQYKCRLTQSMSK